jgi:hypothetical protein
MINGKTIRKHTGFFFRPFFPFKVNAKNGAQWFIFTFQNFLHKFKTQPFSFSADGKLG